MAWTNGPASAVFEAGPDFTPSPGFRHRSAQEGRVVKNQDFLSPAGHAHMVRGGGGTPPGCFRAQIFKQRMHVGHCWLIPLLLVIGFVSRSSPGGGLPRTGEGLWTTCARRRLDLILAVVKLVSAWKPRIRWATWKFGPAPNGYGFQHLFVGLGVLAHRVRGGDARRNCGFLPCVAPANARQRQKKTVGPAWPRCGGRIRSHREEANDARLRGRRDTTNLARPAQRLTGTSRLVPRPTPCEYYAWGRYFFSYSTSTGFVRLWVFTLGGGRASRQEKGRVAGGCAGPRSGGTPGRIRARAGVRADPSRSSLAANTNQGNRRGVILGLVGGELKRVGEGVDLAPTQDEGKGVRMNEVGQVGTGWEQAAEAAARLRDADPQVWDTEGLEGGEEWRGKKRNGCVV